MEKITITEALSEINLIKKKIASKRTKILSALVRVEHVKDPFESDGGSAKMIDAETQSVNDLHTRLINIRSGVSEANLAHTISISEVTMSIHNWLIWKREIAKDNLAFLKNECTTIKGHTDALSTRPQMYKDANDQPQFIKTVVNADYAKLLHVEERMSGVFEQLDGKLSLKNATILIEI